MVGVTKDRAIAFVWKKNYIFCGPIFLLLGSALFPIQADGETAREPRFIAPVSRVETKADPLSLKRVELSTCSLNYSSSFANSGVIFTNLFRKGIASLHSFYENPTLKMKRSYWIVNSPEALEAIFYEELKMKDATTLEKIKQIGSYRNRYHTLLYFPGDLKNEWALRVLLSDYARSLSAALTPGIHRKGHEVQWLESGLATWAAWKSSEEVLGGDGFQKKFKQYYLAYYDTESAMDLEQLSTPEGWRDSLRENASLTIAQAALSYAKLADVAGQGSGVVILRLLEREKDFSSAFKRGSGVTLSEFKKRELID